MNVSIWIARLIFVLIAALRRMDQYLILCIVLLFFMSFHAINGLWYGDFWMHSSVVRELAAHPWAPRHPQLLVNAPHAFFSPYNLGIAWISRSFHLNSIDALTMGGFINFLLFVIGLKVFISLLLGDGRRAFYALFFILFLWGPHAWNYSGFFHFGILGYVLPYPSTFAMGLVFFTLAMSIVFLRDGNSLMLFFIFLCSSIILLSHPLSAIVLYLGMIALAINHAQDSQPHNYFTPVLLLLIIPASFLIACLWPYYPFFKLLLFQGGSFDADNRRMYHEVFGIASPAILLGLPPLILRIKDNWLDPLGIMFAGLFLIYVYGGISHHYAYGRVISSLMLILHLSLASWLYKKKFTALTLPGKCFFGVMVLFSIAGVYINCNFQSLGYLPGLRNNYDQYLFLQKYTGPDDVVLSDKETSAFIPSFGGKIVALNDSLPFIEDYKRRQQDIDIFFSRKASLSDRKSIVMRYRVDDILINRKNPLSRALPPGDIAALGHQIFADKDFILVKIDKNL